MQHLKITDQTAGVENEVPRGAMLKAHLPIHLKTGQL